jgi:NAD+ kinase
VLPLHHRANRFDIFSSIVHKVKLVSTAISLYYTRWAIVYNPSKPEANVVAQDAAEILRKAGAQVKVAKKADEILNSDIELIASVGGDGTMLGCVEAALSLSVPMVGINMGKLGYLTRVNASVMESALDKILHGKFHAMERTVLEATFPDGQKRYALNDVVIKSADFRLAEMDVFADGEHVTEYNCDGVIFATPTGSTAYNLSAGGPILHQSIEGIVMTPICPHSLRSRSVIFNSHSLLKVAPAAKHGKLHVNVDGMVGAEGDECLPIEICEAPSRLKTLEDPDNFGAFTLLKRKLNW